ncbi:MAG: response regulator, partial [Candidatus Omnitrophica bacterium]|nr:response regulator [Candidatus Omnitrophota bacterium]
DLVLLDFNMPQLNGIQVMEQFSSLDPNGYLPVLMISAEEDAALRVKALQSGAKDFIKKPYERLEVLLRSRNLIEVRLLYNQTKTQNRSLEEGVRERTKELYQTRIDVVQRLGRVAEYRDTDTGKHIMRMSRYVECLARAAGLGPAQCELLLNTSPLHDIGKLAIPDVVLLKPGKLDPQEFEVMKTHTTLGAQMLAGGDSVFLKMAETIALTHHEKYNGSGYPKGLRGEDIPLAGRICAVGDVFDALTSVRPYKKAWPLPEAFNEIRAGNGTHFDPKLVEAFLDIQKDIQNIYETYQ